MKIISISINVDKIDKSELILGKKGRYLPLTIIVNDKKDNYGNDVVAHLSQSEEERKEKKGKKYFGNGRVIYSSNTQVKDSPEQPEDDLPF